MPVAEPGPVPVARPGPTSPGPGTCCAELRGAGGNQRRAATCRSPAATCLPVPPARHFHTSMANQGRARRQAPPRAGRAGEAALPSRAPGTAGSSPGGGSGHAWPGGDTVLLCLGTPSPRPSLATDPAGGAGDRSQLSATVSSTGGAVGHPAAPAAGGGDPFGFPGDNPECPPAWTPLLRAGCRAAKDSRAIMKPPRVGGTGCRVLLGEGSEGTQHKLRRRSLQLILNCLYYTDTELRTDIT